MRKQKIIFSEYRLVAGAALFGYGYCRLVKHFAAVYNEEHSVITDFSQNYGKQMMWILTSLVIAFYSDNRWKIL